MTVDFGRQTATKSASSQSALRKIWTKMKMFVKPIRKLTNPDYVLKKSSFDIAYRRHIARGVANLVKKSLDEIKAVLHKYVRIV